MAPTLRSHKQTTSINKLSLPKGSPIKSPKAKVDKRATKSTKAKTSTSTTSKTSTPRVTQKATVKVSGVKRGGSSSKANKALKVVQKSPLKGKTTASPKKSTKAPLPRPPRSKVLSSKPPSKGPMVGGSKSQGQKRTPSSKKLTLSSKPPNAKVPKTRDISAPAIASKVAQKTPLKEHDASSKSRSSSTPKPKVVVIAPQDLKKTLPREHNDAAQIVRPSTPKPRKVAEPSALEYDNEYCPVAAVQSRHLGDGDTSSLVLRNPNQDLVKESYYHSYFNQNQNDLAHSRD